LNRARQPEKIKINKSLGVTHAKGFRRVIELPQAASAVLRVHAGGASTIAACRMPDESACANRNRTKSQRKSNTPRD
jgi:hypothetical protein